MRQRHLLIDVRPPARRRGHRHIPVHDLRRSRGQLILPRHIVYVDLHNPHIRQRGAQARAHETAQVAVVVVRCHIVLIHLRQIPHLLGLAEPVPRHVYHEHIRRVALEIRNIIPHIKQILPRAYARAGGILYLPQALRLVHIDLQPQHIELLQNLRDPQRPLRLEVEVQIQVQINIIPHRVAERPDKLLDMRHQPLRRVLIRAAHAAAEPAPESRVLARHQDIRLQRREPARLNLLAQRRHRIPRIYRRRPQDVVMPNPRAAAMRPIHPHLIARRPPEQLRHRNPQRLRLDVYERAIQPGDSLRRDAARTLPRNPIHILKPHLKRARILPNQQRLHIPNRPLYPMRRPPVAALPPPCHPLIRLHLHKHPRPPPRVHNKRLYIRNLHLRAHSPSLLNCPTRNCQPR